MSVKGELVKVVNKFTYQDTTLSQSIRIDDEVAGRIAKVSATFGKLLDKVWGKERTDLSDKDRNLEGCHLVRVGQWTAVMQNNVTLSMWIVSARYCISDGSTK